MGIFLENHPGYKNSYRLNLDELITLGDFQTDKQIHEFIVKHWPMNQGRYPNQYYM